MKPQLGERRIEKHVQSVWVLVLNGVVVCGLAALTIGLAFVNLHGWNLVVALLIAAAKATLVAVFFMELRFSGGLPRLVLLGGLFWFGVLLMGTLDDVLTRGWLAVPGK